MVQYISFLIVFVSLLFISACEKKEVKNETLKIAAIEPLSGPYAAVGQDLVEQLTFYADLVNSNGGLKDGRKIEIVALDNAMKAEMEELRGNNRIRFLEGERFMHLSRTD